MLIKTAVCARDKRTTELLNWLTPLKLFVLSKCFCIVETTTKMTRFICSRARERGKNNVCCGKQMSTKKANMNYVQGSCDTHIEAYSEHLQRAKVMFTKKGQVCFLNNQKRHCVHCIRATTQRSLCLVTFPVQIFNGDIYCG